MKAYEENIDTMLTGRAGNELMGRVVFRGKGNAYYSVTVDEETNSLKIYKSGFPDDRLNLTLSSANVLLIK